MRLGNGTKRKMREKKKNQAQSTTMRLSEEKTREKTKIKRTQVQETTMRLSKTLSHSLSYTLVKHMYQGIYEAQYLIIV